jgi:hypothetical protein
VAREVSFGKLRVERLRPIGFFPRLLSPHRLCRFDKDRYRCVGESELRMRQREVPVGFNCFFEKIDRHFPL